MPGQVVGTKLPPPNETVFSAQIVILKQGGRYSQKWNYQGEEAIAKRVQTFLYQAVKELNGE